MTDTSNDLHREHPPTTSTSTFPRPSYQRCDQQLHDAHQSFSAFGLPLFAVAVGVVWLPVGPWERGSLALGVLFLVGSSFTLAKCVRDRQETQEITHRVDQARVRISGEGRRRRGARVPRR